MYAYGLISKLTSADGHMKSLLLNVPHDSVAVVYGLMGLNYETLGDNDSALRFHEKSLNIWLNLYGHTDHPDIADSYNDMVNVYDSQRNYSKALQYGEEPQHETQHMRAHWPPWFRLIIQWYSSCLPLTKGLQQSPAIPWEETQHATRSVSGRPSPGCCWLIPEYQWCQNVVVWFLLSSSILPGVSLSPLQHIYCDEEEVKFLYIHDRLIVAQYYSCSSGYIQYWFPLAHWFILFIYLLCLFHYSLPHPRVVSYSDRNSAQIQTPSYYINKCTISDPHDYFSSFIFIIIHFIYMF